MILSILSHRRDNPGGFCGGGNKKKLRKICMSRVSSVVESRKSKVGIFASGSSHTYIPSFHGSHSK